MKKITLFAACLCLILVSCVTQKKRGDVSKAKKFYHDVTSEFNGYFNANEIYIAAEASLNEQEPLNYSKLLPIYPYSAVSNPKAQASNLDVTIQKMTKVSALHQPSQWVDDCYLLAGKAQYLKQDYESAEETFEFLIEEYGPKAKLKKKKKKKNARPKTKVEAEKVRKEKAKTRKQINKEKDKERKAKRKAAKKRRKEREKERARAKKARKKGKPVPKKTTTPTPSFEEAAKEDKAAEEAAKKEEEKKDELNLDDPQGKFKHLPAYQMGMVWLARTYTERDKFNEAGYVFKELKAKQMLYKDVQIALSPAMAHYYIKQKKYNDAIPHLEEAIETATNRNDRARYAYILAQIYQREGNYASASEYFDQVIKARPSYEMEFSARMNEILNQYQSGGTSIEKATKSLERLTKDEKNLEYKDRIYFAIAEIYLKNNNEDKGVEYLELALKEGRGNSSQRSEAFLKLGEIYYEKGDYVKASDYYRQGIAGLKKTDERYEDLKELSQALAQVANQIKTIQLQDSLLIISKLSPDEKRTFAFDLKKKQDEQKRQLLISQSANNANTGSRQVGGNPTRQGLKSNWFAYDDKSLKRGLRDFQKTWGDRTLEDNWRRSAASSAVAIESDTTSTITTISDDQVANLLKGVPQSKRQVEQAESRIEEAYFELGTLFREQLVKYRQSIEAHEELLRRFPETEHEPEVLYYMYKSHEVLGNDVNAKNSEEKLINKYPESIFAKVLTDPAYAAKINDEKLKLNNFYDQTFQSFTNGKYDDAYNKLQQVESKFGKTNELAGRFDLLNAMTVGKLQGKDAYVKGLKDVVARYPNTDEQRKAREILRLLGETGPSLPGGAKRDGVAFKYDPESIHYVILALEPDASLNDAKIDVSKFNNKYHKLAKLKTSNIFLTPKDSERFPIIVVRRFKGATEALDYYKSVQLNKADFIKNTNYQIYPVTQTSYRQIIKNRSLEGYPTFFEENYEF